MTQKERVARFRRLHEGGPLVLPSVWDAASVRVIERAGAPAIGTTSAGASWAHGPPARPNIVTGRWSGALYPMTGAHHEHVSIQPCARATSTSRQLRAVAVLTASGVSKPFRLKS